MGKYRRKKPIDVLRGITVEQSEFFYYPEHIILGVKASAGRDPVGWRDAQSEGRVLPIGHGYLVSIPSSQLSRRLLEEPMFNEMYLLNVDPRVTEGLPAKYKDRHVAFIIYCPHVLEFLGSPVEEAIAPSIPLSGSAVLDDLVFDIREQVFPTITISEEVPLKKIDSSSKNYTSIEIRVPKIPEETLAELVANFDFEGRKFEASDYPPRGYFLRIPGDLIRIGLESQYGHPRMARISIEQCKRGDDVVLYIPKFGYYVDHGGVGEDITITHPPYALTKQRLVTVINSFTNLVESLKEQPSSEIEARPPKALDKGDSSGEELLQFADLDLVPEFA